MWDTLEGTDEEAAPTARPTEEGSTMTAALHPADAALKATHRAMWALGDYPALAADIIPELGEVLAAAAGTGPGQRVLDVAAGSGNAAIPAALRGAEVTASDLTPELFAAGRAAADRKGAHLAWQEADAEALPFPDDAFDVVMSCVGVMFAPHHQAAANELTRVTRPGGTVAVLSWTPGGFIGQMFAVLKPYAPPPPPGSSPPPLWGEPAHVQALLGDRVSAVVARKQTVLVTLFATPEQFRDYFKARYGPTIAVYRHIAADPARTARLDQDLAALARRDMGPDGAMAWEYLLVTATAR